MPQQIKIHGLGSSGEGVGKFDGLAIFVEGALPDEEILVEIETLKKNYAVGRLVEIVKASSERAEPFCPLYKDCGGRFDFCKSTAWQKFHLCGQGRQRRQARAQARFPDCKS